jgi:hypothetical protein
VALPVPTSPVTVPVPMPVPVSAPTSTAPLPTQASDLQTSSSNSNPLDQAIEYFADKVANKVSEKINGGTEIQDPQKAVATMVQNMPISFSSASSA